MIVIRGPICAGKSSLCYALRDSIPNSSLVSADKIKRAIDNTTASRWRDEIAFKNTVHLTKLLIKVKRVVIIDIHSNNLKQLNIFKALARRNRYNFNSYLLFQPLATCIERNHNRAIPDVKYSITDNEIKSYWKSTIKIKGEKIIDTSLLAVTDICRNIDKS